MNQNTPNDPAEVATIDAPAITEVAPTSIFSDIKAFGNAQRMAQLLATSNLVPDKYQNNISNCTIAIELAQRIGASPFAVMQNLYIVQGKPSWSAVFIIATINSCGKFSPMRYEMTGEDQTRACRACAMDLAHGNEMLSGPWVTWKMAVSEGWVQKKGSKWMTMPEVMFRYRAASFFGKMYCPELLMGMQSAEEARDIIDITPDKGGTFGERKTGIEGATRKLDEHLNATKEAEKRAEHVDTGTGEIIRTTGQDDPHDGTANDPLALADRKEEEPAPRQEPKQEPEPEPEPKGSKQSAAARAAASGKKTAKDATNGLIKEELF